ncbi:hypothetical protein L202_06947 [Cryptococcus amylolentus CBS 6039]|uniref:J domain-containing protein n=2 Tax=Cryptococcus amylolentus TaxID=104669 RepID=A0A1E3HE26_9TREE|nr:hypothetical protein L202_06947 [Cryptococcus amylolentus CBS 6039]ODN74588.1 hypothetical protein L202_06947 [Cryptococcus amylolentus CBS 6039]ODO01550.1 hypothetical protein I350_06370 [Cryptococcus amylolentus CBS 6273]
MRFLAVLCLFAALTVGTLAWTKEDYEIFDLVSALETAEGKGVNFYSHLSISPSATTQQITKAYRKKSLELHPDKNPGVKDIEERFARLGLIAGILRGKESRERYNFFYKNGVPRWRGTGYYYARYRPTLSHTLVFLVLLSNLFHRLVLQLNFQKHRARISYFETAAKSAAGVLSGSGKGGVDAGAIQGRRRKVKVPMVEGNDYSGTLELIVSGDQVYLPQDDGHLTPISTLAPPPSFSQTWLPSLALSLARRAVSRLPPSTQESLPAFLRDEESAEADELELDDEEDEDAESEVGRGTPTPMGRASRRALQRGKGRNGKGSKNNTPKDSPAGTEAESDIALDNEAPKKKKKPGLGKAAAMRQRKLAAKN